jgi:hypothetical protein
MGLDIHAASHLQYVRPIPQGVEFDRLEEEVNRQDKCLDEVYFLLFPNDPEWKGHLAGMEPGLYEYTAATEKHGFRAGPYSYYNAWREHLSHFALGVEPSTVWKDPGQFAGRPFVELINFTDCDGRIGTRLAAKLAADFHAHAVKAEEFAALLDGDESFIDNYRDFARAFELAAQQGRWRSVSVVAPNQLVYLTGAALRHSVLQCPASGPAD